MNASTNARIRIVITGKASAMVLIRSSILAKIGRATRSDWRHRTSTSEFTCPAGGGYSRQAMIDGGKL
jgi:hypothetical protein